MRAWTTIAVLCAACSATPPPEEAQPTIPAHDDGGVQAPSTADPSSPPTDSEARADPATPPPEPAATPAPDPIPHWEPSQSTSIGSVTHGHLDGSVPLPLRSPGLIFRPDKDPASRFGTVELVGGLVRAAAAVERADPGAPLTVGDVSREAGGDIPGHASHRAGRDVDVLFYLRRSETDEPFVPSKPIPLDPEGRGTDYGDLADPGDDVPVHIDLARTWSFVAALLADEAVSVQKIFIVEHLRARLLEHARSVEAPTAVVDRFADVTCQPRFPHDDHMHIQVFCSVDDIAAGCEDVPPIHPWHARALAEAGTKAVLAGKPPPPPREAKPRPKLKSIDAARSEAGPMHEDVVAFLDRREAWAKKPHPGRRWCK